MKLCVFCVNVLVATLSTSPTLHTWILGLQFILDHQRIKDVLPHMISCWVV